jgi:hypothetical protein
MKIGILTYHRSHNYGALLQAVALRHVLEQLGHDVYFVDYWPEYHKDIYRIYNHACLNKLSLLRKLKYIISATLSYPKIRKRRIGFNHFISKFILPYTKNVNSKFDCLVYGSDQIWRKQPGLGNNKLNSVYFGEHEISTLKHWSYAASMGIITLNEKEKSDIHQWLSKFEKISVRETDLRNAILDCGVSNVKQVLDPTMLLSKEDWIQLLSLSILEEEKPYILFYDLLPNSFNMTYLNEFAIKNNCEIKTIKGSVQSLQKQSNELPFVTPKGMVELIANARYVFTSSFHGLVFALIFNKQVYAAFSKNSTRAKSLLDDLGLSERLLLPKSIIPDMPSIDYRKVESKLQELRKDSINFLRL